MACSLLINDAHALCFHQRKRAYRVTNYIQFLVWKKRTRKIVRVPERLYHLLLIHFYQSRYDYAVCTHLKVYPTSLSLSREVYPILRISHFSEKYQQDNEAVSCHIMCGKFPYGKKEREVGYTFLDRSLKSVYS